MPPESNNSQIPTVELHRHWEAGISPKIFAKLAERNKIKALQTPQGETIKGVEPQNPQSVENYIQGVINGLRQSIDTMGKFLIAFRALNSVICTEEDIAYAIYAQLVDEQAAGSLHTELRGSPLSITQRTKIPVEGVIKAVEFGILQAWARLRMSATQIVCFSREKGLDPSNPDDLFKNQAPAVIRAVANNYISDFPIGLDIAGMDEIKFPPDRFHAIFAPAREAGIPITVHAGEQGKPPNFTEAPPEIIREALRLGARRIGHGTSAIADPELMKRLKDEGIGVETCPVSNHLMGYMPIAKHPLRHFLREGVLATAGTDDPVFFGVASVREMLKQYADDLGLRHSDRWKLVENGIEIAFVSEKRRQHLRQALADCGVGA